MYLLLGPHGELVYIGKATNLRRRLLDHARATASRRMSNVREVRWIECAHEREALCREADLIVALSPPGNAAMAEESFTFVCVEQTPAGADRVRLRFRLTEQQARAPARTYGVFPHLGKGRASWVGVRTNLGYSAFLRLLWVAFAERAVRDRLPAKLRGSSPPLVAETTIDRGCLPMLHDFLSGRSDRILGPLCDAVTSHDAPAYMQRPLQGDLEAAQEFHRLGPHALRRLRRRHGLRPGPVDRETFTRLLTDDLRRTIGEFELPSRSSDVDIVGRRIAVSMRRRGD